MREQGSPWPLITVAVVALLLLVIPTVIVARKKSSRMATVEAQVLIGDAVYNSDPAANILRYRWPDSEVPRTAERLRDATAVAIASISTVVEGEMIGHPCRNAAEILSAIAYRKLLPAEWLTPEPGVLRMVHGTVHLRYSPYTSAIEVVSVPGDRKDGPALLIRIPDRENITVGPRYFESMQLDGIIYPPPFAPIAEVISAGWQPRLFKQTQLPDAERAQLEHWASAVRQK